MSILVNKNTRVVVQGITGHEGLFHTEQMLAYGTRVVAGVRPGKGGEWVAGGKVPVFDTLRSAVGAALGLNVFHRHADKLVMGNIAQTVNVIGAIKTSRNHAALDPAGHVLALYRAHLLGDLVPVSVPANAPLDAVAAWDKKAGASFNSMTLSRT
jgi:succinyl-CoA synthetase alpha subunit